MDEEERKLLLSLMEEEIMPEEERNKNKGAAIDVDNAGKHGEDHVVLDVDDSLANSMVEILNSTRGKPTHRHTIFRVPEDIRNDDPGAYSPKVVCIGLFHHQKLKGLEERKWHYLENVRSRSKNNLNLYIKEMKKTVIEAGFCYSGYPESGCMEMWFEEILKLMLVDGCFIINLLLQLVDGMVEINDPIYSDRWTLPRVGHDMLLLENQLPFSVLEKLWELTGFERPALKTKVLEFFRNLLPEEHDLKLPETEEVHHLLHLIHLSLQPISPMKKPESKSSTPRPGPLEPNDTLSSTKNPSSEGPKSLQPASPTKKSESTSGTTIPRPPQPSDTASSSTEPPCESSESHQPRSRQKRSHLLPNDQFPIPQRFRQIPSVQQIKQISEPRPPPPPPKTIPSATELQEAGVKFQRKKARSFLEVTFERGLMQIPRLTISDSTNSLFRNFIAFEQGFPDCGSHFTSYCNFMDSLINTPRDVEILKQSGIIEHVLGSDEEVALLFNKLCKGITWDFKNSYLAKVFENVNQHTQKRWPKWRAKLVRDYFSSPWAILSLTAAIVILILTFLQTYFAVFAYFRPP